MSKKYYPEIDGLRAIAVLCVLLFHLDPNGIVPGGYIGVDVFFVISGYLITGIIFNDMQEGTFNYFQFLGRRIARLYPALLFTVFLIICIGFFTLNQAMYSSVAKSLKYTLFSIANIRFMKHEEGYWDPLAVDNPTLHTWSLGVEQQFYIIFPLIVYFVYKGYKTQRAVSVIVSFISLFSFIFAQFFSMYNVTASFYFTASRLFELSVGGLLAVEYTRFKYITNIKKEILLSLGIALILVCACLYYSDIKYHPGVTTLPIIIGSLLCIACCDAKYIGCILRNRVAVYLGKISYSIYLIHWPLIVFCKVVPQERALSLFSQVILFVLSIILASIMYYFIENKYRRISISLFSKTGRVFLSIFTLLLVLNYSVSLLNGVPQRLTPYPKEVEDFSMPAWIIKEYSSWRDIKVLGDTRQKPIALFVGDSYLGQYIEQIDSYFKRKNQSVFFIASSGCSESHIYWGIGESCLRNTKYHYESLDNHLPVIRINWWSKLFELGARGKLYDEDLHFIKVSSQDIFEQILSEQKIVKNKILFILTPPLFTKRNGFSAKAPIYNLFPFDLTDSIQYGSDESRVQSNDLMIQFINDQPEMEYLSTYNIFCKGSLCQNYEPSSGIFYYFDDNHLSRYGAKLVWENIGDQVYDFILRNNPDVKNLPPQEERIDFIERH